MFRHRDADVGVRKWDSSPGTTPSARNVTFHSLDLASTRGFAKQVQVLLGPGHLPMVQPGALKNSSGSEIVQR